MLAQYLRAILVFAINVPSHYITTAWLMAICHRHPCNRHNESEAKCTAFVMKTWFHSYANKTHFHTKSFTLSLVFVIRFKATQKWPFTLSAAQYKCSRVMCFSQRQQTREKDFRVHPTGVETATISSLD